MFKTLANLPKTAWLIGLISFVNDSASEMLYPILPLYLTSVLMAGPKALGLIEGIADAASSMLRLASGVFVDKLSRVKPWLLVGYGLASVSRPLMILANSWTVVIGIRLADRIGKGLRSSPRDALLAASVDRHQHGLALLPASVVFGVLYESLSPAVAFGFSGACAMSACLLLWRWFGRSRA